MKGFPDVLLERVLRGARRSRHLISLGTVEIEVVGLDWGYVGRVFLQILIAVQRVRHLVVEGLPDLLRADVVNELGCGLNANFGLDLLDEGVGIDLALVEALESIVKFPIGLISILKVIRSLELTREDLVDERA